MLNPHTVLLVLHDERTASVVIDGAEMQTRVTLEVAAQEAQRWVETADSVRERVVLSVRFADGAEWEIEQHSRCKCECDNILVHALAMYEAEAHYLGTASACDSMVSRFELAVA